MGPRLHSRLREIALGSAMELPQQVRSQIEFGNEGNKAPPRRTQNGYLGGGKRHSFQRRV